MLLFIKLTRILIAPTTTTPRPPHLTWKRLGARLPGACPQWGNQQSALGTQQSAFGHSAIRIGHSAVRIAHSAIHTGRIVIRIMHSGQIFRKASEGLEDMLAKLRGLENYFRKSALCSPRFVPSMISLAILRSPMCV